MSTLVVPGVRVETRFDVLPPLPAPSGIVGIVGIVDRPPDPNRLLSVTKTGEVRDVLGPGTTTSMPEAVHALGNGAAEVVVSPVEGGSPSSVTLNNGDGNAAVQLRVRSNGAWGDSLRADIQSITDAAGEVVRVAVRILRDGEVAESFSDLIVSAGQPGDLFDAINSTSSYVVATDPGFAASVPSAGTFALVAEGVTVTSEGTTDELFTILPEAAVDPTGVTVRIEVPQSDRISVSVLRNGAEQESFTRLTMDPDSARYLPSTLLAESSLIRVRQASSLAEGSRLPAATIAPIPFAGGSSPTVAQYRTAIDRMADDSRINLVLASIEPQRTASTVSQIHQALVAHAVTQTDEGSPRIAFGSVTPPEQPSLDLIRDHAAAVRNRRFVLVSPTGAEGAVAGAISRTSPEISPTFKPVPLFGIAPATYRNGELNRLLGPSHNILVVQQRVGRGVVVLRGLDTSGDQISVTRVADSAIREVKAISENFIGRLNTNDARAALRGQIVATFTRMERAGALVPSTDGTDPAFLVDVYSTQLDFAQGIVRIDLAVRPVRAIDYVYALLRIKN